MWPATGSMGSTSPRKRGKARASMRPAPPASRTLASTVESSAGAGAVRGARGGRSGSGAGGRSRDPPASVQAGGRVKGPDPAGARGPQRSTRPGQRRRPRRIKTRACPGDSRRGEGVSKPRKGRKGMASGGLNRWALKSASRSEESGPRAGGPVGAAPRSGIVKEAAIHEAQAKDLRGRRPR